MFKGAITIYFKGKSMNTDLTTNTNKSLSTTSALDLEFIKKQFFPANATEKDIEFCLRVSQTYSLNPILREIFFVERRANVNGIWIIKVEPLVSRDGLLTIAHKSGCFGGLETKSFVKEMPQLINGQWETKKDLVAQCTVYRTDTERPFVSEVAYSEYVQKTKEGVPTKFWLEKPDTMLKKVAESQALRKAFNINGVYIPEEISGIQEVGGGNENTGIYVEKEETPLDDEPDIFQEAELELDNTSNEISALKALGLEAEEKNGYLKIIGNTFQKEAHIKALGYTLHKSSSGENIWVKKLA